MYRYYREISYTLITSGHCAECRDISATFRDSPAINLKLDWRNARHTIEKMARKSRGVHVFFVFTKIALNKPLVPYGFRGPLYLLCCCFRTSRRYIKTGIKTHFFYILLVWETALCLLMDIILWRNSFAVLPYGDFNLIVRETLWKILGDCIEWKLY